MNDELAGQVLEALNDKVDIDYGNMPANSTNYAPSSKNVTNCITEIPQDIKLEYSGNTITLKSGSIIYIPNGVGVFDKYTYTSDVTLNISVGVTAKLIVFINANTKNLAAQAENCFYSGDNPTISTSIAIWYDTTENKIKFSDDSGSTWRSPYTFPIAVITTSNGAVTSIDQVFNGFGYIGSVRYALPGIKWLSPAGRDEDGTAKSIFNTLQKVVYEDFASQREYIPNILGTGSIWTTGSYVESETEPSDSYSVWYRPSDNYIRVRINNGAWDINRAIINVGNFTTDGTRVTKLNVKPMFSTLDYNNTKYIAHQAFPSDKYINLTLGASGSKYQAVADGYFVLTKSCNATGQIITIFNLSNQIESKIRSGTTNGAYSVFIPCQKGDTVQVDYTFGSTTNYFRFIYANGSK